MTDSKRARLKMHPDIEKAIKEKNYQLICSYLHTNHFESDSEWTVQRCNDSFIQGWSECEKLLSQALNREAKLAEALEAIVDETLDNIACKALEEWKKVRDEK